MNRAFSCLILVALSSSATASVCTDAVPNADLEDNERAAAELLCDLDAGEVLVGIFFEDHPGSYDYWLDGVGLLCAPAEDLSLESRVYLGPDLALSPGAVSDLRCDGGELATGVAYNKLTMIGRTRVDSATLLCGEDQDLMAFPAQQAPSAPVTALGCPAGEILVGLSYKDDDGDAAEDGTYFTDAVDSITAICAPAESDAQVVELNDLLDNGRPLAALACDTEAGEVMVGAFYDDHPAPASDWADGVGVYCAPADDPSAVTILTLEEDIAGAEDHALACPAGEAITGVAFAETYGYGQWEVDAVTLLCGESATAQPNADVSTTLNTALCPLGEVAVGLAYKDQETDDGSWSDGMDAVTVLCAPETCE